MCCAVREADTSAYLQKELFHLLPVIDAPAAADLQVVWSGEQNSFAAKATEVQWLIVDQIVGIQNSFIAAEDEMCWRQKRKMAAQPAELGSERVGKLHSRRSDKNLILLGQRFHHALAIGHDS